MKIVKTDMLDFLKMIRVKAQARGQEGSLGEVNEVIIEEDGSVATGFQNKAVMVFGKAKTLKFERRIAVSNVELLISMLDALESPDNMVNMQFDDQRMLTMTTRLGKYSYRLADPSAVEDFAELKDRVEDLISALTVNLTLSAGTTKGILKAIRTLSADRVALHSTGGIVSAVVYDDGTKSTATIELGDAKEDFKQDYAAQLLAPILAKMSEDGTRLQTAPERTAVIAPKDASFRYLISPLKTATE